MSERVCPNLPSMKSCWWVKAGNPHAGEGHGCVCLIPVDDWEPKVKADTGMDDVDAVIDLLVAQYGLPPEAIEHIVRITVSRQNSINRVLGRPEVAAITTKDGES